MKNLAYALLAAGAILCVQLLNAEKVDPPKPCPPDKPCPVPIKPKPRPWGDGSVAPVGADKPGKPVLGGPVAPDGKTEIVCDLPVSEKKKNTGGRDGAGLCVFTSIEYCARWQSEIPLVDFQKVMKGEPGGGYPEKVERMIAKYAPGVEYLQDTSGDLNIIRSALKSGRMVAVTYCGYDPHYRGYVAHMVDCVLLDDSDDGWACINDNNDPEKFVWMSVREFKRRYDGNGKGWCVILFAPAPPLPPAN